jgi:anti-sigma B factor antagonist
MTVEEAGDVSPERETFVIQEQNIDASNVWEIGAALRQTLHGGTPQLWVDLRNVKFADSAGLGMLVGLQKEAREIGGGVHLLNIGREVSRLFQITGVGNLFEG